MFIDKTLRADSLKGRWDHFPSMGHGKISKFARFWNYRSFLQNILWGGDLISSFYDFFEVPKDRKKWLLSYKLIPITCSSRWFHTFGNFVFISFRNTNVADWTKNNLQCKFINWRLVIFYFILILYNSHSVIVNIIEDLISY